jgi:flavodoxin
MNDETKKINLSRRDMLRISTLWVLSGISIPLLSHPSISHSAETDAGKKKILIVYFSRTGNTRTMARLISEKVGGDLIELQVVEAYPEDYEAVKERAMQELNTGLKPELKTKVGNLGAYDVIFVGTPIWWGTISAPVKSFLSEYDLSGKTIVPFITHQGSFLGRSVSDIKALCPRSTLQDGLAVWGKDAKTSQNEVAAWVRGLRLKQ